MPRRKGKKQPLNAPIEASGSSLQNNTLRKRLLEIAFENTLKSEQELLTTLINYEKNILSLNKEDLDPLRITLREVERHLKKLKNCLDFVDRETNLDSVEFRICWLVSLATAFICDIDTPLEDLTFNQEYNQSVQLQLYPAHILDIIRGIEGHYNLFSVRLNENNNIECMVCNYFVSQTKIDSLFEHICSLYHMDQLKLHHNNLSKYHDFWIQQQSTKQNFQLLYSYIDEKDMKCKQCGVLIKYDEVLLHPIPCKYPNAKTSKNIAQPICELGYSKKVKTSIFLDVPYLTIDGISYPVMHRIPVYEKKCVCMICCCIVSENFSEHCEDDMHLFFQSSWILMESFKKYHKIFSSIATTNQIQLIYYSLYINNIFCLPCKRDIDLNRAEIETHMKSNDHHNNLKSMNDTDFIIHLLNLFEDNFHNINIPSIIVGENDYPTIQICHDNTLYCLTCHLTLRRTITEHLNQAGHIKSEANERNRSSLALYHDVFKSLPNKYQNEQKFFRKRASDIRCVLCSGCIALDGPALLQHIETRHPKTQKSQDVGIPDVVGVEDISEGGVNIEGYAECSSKPSTPTPLFVQHEQMINLRSNHNDNLKTNSLLDKNKIDLKSTQDLKIGGSKDKGYNPITIKKIFEDVPHTYINGAIYPAFQKIGNTFHCLFCMEKLRHSLDKHLDLSKHQKKLDSPENALYVQKYHEIFCSLPCELQLQQIHFKRNKNKLVCLLCEHAFPLNLQYVRRHMSTKKHKTFFVEDTNISETIYKRNLVCNYVHKDFDDFDTLMFLMDKKVKGNNHNILETVFQANPINIPCAFINKKMYPVMQIINRNLHCLICSKDVIEDPFEHVVTNLIHLGKESVAIKRVIKYYDIWNSLPDNVQIQQALFQMTKKYFKCLVCPLNLPYDAVLIMGHLNTQEHEESILNHILTTQRTNQLGSILTNKLGYYVHGNLRLDSMLYLMDIEISKNKENVLDLKNLYKNDLESNEILLKDTAADHFPVQSLVLYENIYETRKTELNNLKKKESLVKNISADHFPCQSVAHYDNIYGAYKTTQYKVIKDINDLEKKKLLARNIAGDYFPVQSLVLYENICETSKTELNNLRKKESLVKNISVDYFPCQSVAYYDNVYGAYKTAQYKVIKDINDLEKKKLLVRNIAADNFSLQSVGHQENLYGTYKTTDLELNVNTESLTTFEHSKSDVVVNINTNMNQKQTYNSEDSKQHESNQKALIDFPPYDTAIIDSLYKNGLIHFNLKIDNIKYPVIQNLGLYKHCIICEKSITSEIFHCNSDEHIKNSTNQSKKVLLKQFHQVFALLPKQYQEQQKYFRRKQLLKCILCNVSVPYDFGLVLNHIQEKEHIAKQEKFERSPDTSRSNSPFVNENLHVATKSPKKQKEKNTESITKTNITTRSSNINKPALNGSSTKEILKYSAPAMVKLFQNLEEYTIEIENNKFPVLRKSTLGIRCMLCIDGPVSNPADHIKTPNHIKHTENKGAILNLKKFHLLWMKGKECFQEQLYYIVQRHCHLCQVSLYYDNILSHIESNGHLDNVDQQKSLTLSTELLKIETKSENTKNGTVENQTYVNKNSEMSEGMAESAESTSEIDDIVPNGIDNLNGPDVENDTKVEDIGNTDALQVSYASWVKATIYYGLANYTVLIDGNLLPYLRRTFQGLRCLLCQDEEVSSIADHIKTSHHTHQLTNSKALLCVRDFHDFWSRKNDPISQNQQIFVIDGKCVLCVRYSHRYVNEHLQSKEHRLNEDGVDCDELIDIMKLRDKFCYCEEVQKTLYKDLNQYFTYHGLIKLPLLRLTKEGTRCILCDDTGVTDPARHVNTPSHQQALHSYDRREKLWNFHKMWQKMEPAAQMHQQYVILMMCLACDRKINIETGEAHVLSKAHDGNIKKKDKKQDKVKTVVTHDVKPSLVSPEPHDLISQLPWYFKPHVKVLKSEPNNKNEITCTVCKKNFTNATQLRIHLDNKEHCIASNLDQIKNHFLCEICMRTAKNEKEWMEHLESGHHTTRYQNLGANRKLTMKEYTCVTCNMVIFGDTISVMRHNKSKNNKGSVEITLNKGMKRLLASKKSILTEAMNLVETVDRDIVESKADVAQCCKALERTLSPYYPMCRVYPFGSRVTGLGNRDSDLDVFIDIGGIYDGSRFQSADAQANIVLKVGDLLKKNKAQFVNVVMVPGARTPIVRVFHVATGIDCDISFRHGLSVENTEFIRFCIDLQPILKPALLFLKLWLSNTELPYGTPTSYAFTMLFIFFMQQQNYLLSVEEIRNRNRSGKLKIDGWEVVEYTSTIFEMKKYVKECAMPLPELLKLFFGYYESFNFGNLVVCPLLGHVIDKSHFVPHQPDLPPQMNTYIRKLNAPNAEVLKHHTPMCVQDPFDLSHNVTKGCSGIATKMFQKYCKLSKSQISALQ